MIIYAKIYQDSIIEEMRGLLDDGSLMYFKDLDKFDFQINGLEEKVWN